MIDRPRIAVPVILSAVCLISVGLWQASVPLGDEAGYIQRALADMAARRIPADPYRLWYMFLLNVVSADPLHCHLITRFVTSLIASLLMFFVLGTIGAECRPEARLLTCLFWICCRLNVPQTQFGNINLFALSIVMPALILYLRRNTVNTSLFLILSLFWAAQSRMEYYAPLVLIILFSLFICLGKAKQGRTQEQRPERRAARLLPTIGLSLLLVASVAAVAGAGDRRSMDKYLLLGLSQCYTSLQAKLNPDMKISTMVEFSRIVDDVFGNPDGFLDAVRHNPTEVAKYLLLNGSINSVILVPGLLRHRCLFMPPRFGKKGEIVQIIVVLLAVAAGAFLRLRGRFGTGNCLRDLRAWSVRMLHNHQAMALLILCSAASVSLLLHIPDPRYWITCAPLLLFGVCWSISGLFRPLPPRRAVAVVAVLGLWFTFPLFLGHAGNQDVLRAMRRAPGARSSVPQIAGLYPLAYGTYAFGLRYRAVTVGDVDVDRIRTAGYDFVVIDSYLRNSAFWQEHGEFMPQFEAHPEQWGYQPIGGTTDKYQTVVYSRKHARTGPSPEER